MYPGCQIQMLMDHDPAPVEKKRGRPSAYATEEDRRNARRDQTRDRVRRFRVTQNNLNRQISGYTEHVTQNNLNRQNPGYTDDSSDPAILVHRANAMAKQDLDQFADAAPEYAGAAGFARSDWRHKRDATGELGDAKFLTTDQFKEWLLKCQTQRYGEKKDVPLFSPSLFCRDLYPGHGRTKLNAYAARGIVLDIEHSDLSPDGFADRLPDVEMLIYSSFNHAPEEPRFRICIPTTCHMPPYISQALCEMIAARLAELGYGDSESGKRHGLDASKFVYSSIFTRPSKTDHCFFTHYTDGRRPIDPYQWIEACSFDIWRKVEVIEEVIDTDALAYRPPPLSGGLVEYALNRWRDLGPIRGRGRKEFWFLAKGLSKAGWEKDDIRKTLAKEYMVAHNPAERFGEIDGILAGLT